MKEMMKVKKDLGVDEYLELIKEDKNLNMAYVSLAQYIYLLESKLDNIIAKLQDTKKHIDKSGFDNMTKIITIYELLTMVYNDEAPQMIRYNGDIYTYGWGDYMGDEPISEYYRIKDRHGLGLFCQDNITLETEVEIVLKY